MAFSPSYVGNNSIGASQLALEGDTAYLTQVTIPAGALLGAIEIHGAAGSAAQDIAFSTTVYTDSAGDPDLLLAADFGNVGGTAQAFFAVTARWWTLPYLRYFTSSTVVWIGARIASNSAFQLSYETTGGGDKEVDAGAAWSADASEGTVVDTTNVLSIRGRVFQW